MYRELKTSLRQIISTSTTTVAFLLIIFISNNLYAGYATVFIYHKFGEEDRYPTTSVSMEDFVKQMEYLKKNGYSVIPLSKLVYYLQRREEIPEKTVVITIDDGYRSTMKAYKILKKYNFPFTVFLYAEGVGRYPDYLTKEQLSQLKKDPLVEFGNHSYSHRHFARILSNMDTEEYKKLVVEDTLKAEKRLKKLLGYVPKFYAFPYGEYTKPFIQALREMGYIALFTQDPQNIDKNTPLWLIHRQPVVGSWAKIEHFKKVLNTEVLLVVKHSPDIGYLKNNPPEISAEVKNLDNYKNCGVYISEIGWIKAEKKGNKLYVKLNKPLKKWRNRIAFTCWNKKTKKKATYFWSVYTRKNGRDN